MGNFLGGFAGGAKEGWALGSSLAERKRKEEEKIADREYADKKIADALERGRQEKMDIISGRHQAGVPVEHIPAIQERMLQQHHLFPVEAPQRERVEAAIRSLKRPGAVLGASEIMKAQRDLEEKRGYDEAQVLAGDARAWDVFLRKENIADLLRENNRAYAEALRLRVKGEEELDEKLKQLDDFTINGEIAAGRLAAAKGLTRDANPHPRTTYQSGAWLQGFRKEQADIASAARTAGETYAANWKAKKENVESTWEPVLEKLWGRTHEGGELPDDIRNSALSSFESAKAEVGDLRELQFLQNQYKTAIQVPNAPKEYKPWDKAKADFKTNPKDLAEAVRRIYKIHDAKAERIAKELEETPWETYNVMDDKGAYKHRTWKIRDSHVAREKMNPHTEEGRKNIALANAQLEYESFAVVGKDGMKRSLRAFVPIAKDKLTLIWNKKPEDRTHEDQKVMGTSKVPALPKEGELKGPEAPKEPTLGGLPENPEEGVQYTLEQGDNKAEVMIIGGKWFTLKGGKWVPLPR